MLAVILASLALLACSDDGEPSSTSVSPTDDSATPISSTSSPATTTVTDLPATPPGPTVTFTTASGEDVTLNVEVADTAEERGVGLMNRELLDEDAGMLFDFQGETQSGFWMRNTLIPLSIAFIDTAGTIIDIQDMQPLDETLHFASGPYRYAVEANQGWFARNGVEVGNSTILTLFA
jgi:uncharacterized membrane protein (UPF0127 family)